ncbi:carboxypeptidase-like regulatory domain-containing protein [bacterium]|nr:carboxypeptidase-like regulatory domain-containing protein [bacterium]
MLTRKSFLIIAFVMLGLIINGCFEEDSPSGPDKDLLIGSWKLTSYTIDDQAEETMGIIVTFNDDGSGLVYIYGYSFPMSWSTDGDKLTTTVDGDATTGTYTVNSTTFKYTFDDEDGHNVQTYEKRASNAGYSFVVGEVTDSQTGEGIYGVTVSSDDDNSTTTNVDGVFSLNVGEGTRTITVEKSGYFSRSESVQVGQNATVTLNFIIVPTLSNGEGLLRFVLSWNDEPDDLDSHMETPLIEGQTYHVSYSETGSKLTAPYVTLDHDETDGYGPETITIHQLFTGTYKYYVHNYSEERNLAGCGAQVRIYNSAGLQHTVTVPQTGVGLYWQVCTIDGNGNVSIVNEIDNGGSQNPEYGYIAGRVTHSQTGASVQDAIITTDAGGYTTTDSNGEYSLQVDAGSLTISVNKDGFYGSSEEIYVNANQTSTQNFILTPTLESGEGELRLVLSWQDEPEDLDSYLSTPLIEGSTYTVYYGDEGSVEYAPYAKLDIDDTDGYGPETITIHHLFTGTYKYYIHNYSGSPTMRNCGAKVQIYNTSGLLRTVYVPTTGDGRYWNVCTINGNGEVTVVNELRDEAPSFTGGNALKPKH